MSHGQIIFDDKTISVIRECDNLFTDIDTNGDNQLNMNEFEAYVKKRSSTEQDHQEIMKEFHAIDLNDDGYIQFLEFFRAICNKKKLHLPAEINIFDQLQIYEIMEWRHIT